MTASLAPTTETFRHEVRAWIEANFPESLRGGCSSLSEASRDTRTDESEAWRIAVAAKGWGVPAWPKIYGGAELSIEFAHIVSDELARDGVFNPVAGMGTALLGPTLLEVGTEQQKLEHLPPIARGEVRWCQGFSEPSAGSDLASLTARAEAREDHFIINGQKVWTSGAHLADWMFCILRTDATQKHAGISFFLLPMDQPGISVRPIQMIHGASPFCETFFDNAVALRKDLVGTLNAGWSVAKRLLEHERSSLASGTEPGDAGRPLPQLALDHIGKDDAGRIDDADLRNRIIRYEMENRAYQQTLTRIEEGGIAHRISTATSMMKNVASRLIQTRDELAVEILGHKGLGAGGAPFSEEDLVATRSWLFGKCVTIYGGSHEVQNNIIAKHILGLPS